MPQTPSPSKPPQTAADLLEGLLRSNLLAESLFGQVLEQSRSFLEHRADDYAAALVQKRVLTEWQATELLAGRFGLYAGTFRLFERLTTTQTADVFVAEQPGPQRLVLLQITRVETADGNVAFRSAKGRSFAERKTTLSNMPQHPHIVRCVEIQPTARCILAAYEFIEARWLSELLAVKPIKREHVAELVQQLALVLVVLSHEAVRSIGVEDAWIDPHGQLKLLAGPNPWASESEWRESAAERDKLQLAAVHRFVAALGGLPEIADCRSVNEVNDRLVWLAKPWSEPYARESLRCPRVRMNRLLRRGPSRGLIESIGPELQVAYAGLGSEPGPEAVTAESPAHCPTFTPAFTMEVEGRSLPTTVMAPKSPKVGSVRRALALAALLCLLATGIVSTQWFEQRGARRADATTDPVELPEPQPLVTPAPSRTGHLPLPQSQSTPAESGY